MAELPEIRLAHHLASLCCLHHVVISTDPRCALKLLLNAEHTSLFMPGVTNACRVLEGAGSCLSLQWVPSHSDVPGNDRADALAAVAHLNEEPPNFRDRFTEATRMLHQAISPRYLYTGVSTGTSPYPVLNRLRRRSGAFLLRLRVNCAFTQTALYRLGRLSCPNCVL